MKWRGLLCEDGDTLSLGRIAFWVSFGLAIHLWHERAALEFPSSLTEFLMALLVYNLGKKSITVWSAWAEARKNGG